jgi:hypothetical protein
MAGSRHRADLKRQSGHFIVGFAREAKQEVSAVLEAADVKICQARAALLDKSSRHATKLIIRSWTSAAQ